MYIWKESYTSGNDYNWSHAPWNEHECECDECNGVGEWYRDYDGGIVSIEEYQTLPQEVKDDLEKCYCRKCDGNGVIYY